MLRNIPLKALLEAVQAFNLESHERLDKRIPLSRYFEAEEYALQHPDEFTVLFQCCTDKNVRPCDLTKEIVCDWYAEYPPRLQ